MDEEFDIHLPNRDPGMLLLPGMTETPKPRIVQNPKINHIIATSLASQTIALHRAMIEGKKMDLADFYILFPSFPVIVSNFTFRGRFPRVEGKIVLSGASGRRVRKRLLDSDTDGSHEPKVVARLTQAISDPDFHIPACNEDIDEISDLPFLIEAKNLSNFYHFTTETLIYLYLYKKYDLKGEIQIFTKNPGPPGAFVERSIRSFYPDLIDRIFINQGKIGEERAIIPFNLQHYFSYKRDLGYDLKASSQPDVGCVEPLYRNMKAISRGSRDDALDGHRQLAITPVSQISGPKRVYIRRKSGNLRPIGGEEKLLEMLLGHGFKVVSFEDYTPLEQAGLINGVEILISAHGAGFANMLYGKPNATFIELSHLQNARHRFGDFHMHAGASGVTHVHLFADHDHSDDSAIPDIKDTGLLGVKLPDVAIRRLDGYLKSIIYRHEFVEFRQKIDTLSEAGKQAEICAAVRQDQRFLYSLADIPLAAATAHEAIHDYSEAATLYQISLEVSPFRAPIRLKLINALAMAGDKAGLQRALGDFRVIAPYWYELHFGEPEKLEAILEMSDQASNRT